MTATHRTFKLHGFQFVIQVDGFADQPSQAHALQEFKAGLRELAPALKPPLACILGHFPSRKVTASMRTKRTTSLWRKDWPLA